VIGTPEQQENDALAGESMENSVRGPSTATVIEHMFVLGIDPGLSATGYGLIEGSQTPRAHLAGVIRTDTEATVPQRLAELFRGITQVIADAKPDVVALETVFTNRNLQTAISVGRASGVALLAAAQADLPVYEYVPTAIKSAVTGDGSANKDQVKQMVARLLNLEEAPKPADAADALAIALCHLRAAPLKASR
jgi:crossover junction endodeoxyribonuclease RuvC